MTFDEMDALCQGWFSLDFPPALFNCEREFSLNTSRDREHMVLQYENSAAVAIPLHGIMNESQLAQRWQNSCDTFRNGVALLKQHGHLGCQAMLGGAR